MREPARGRGRPTIEAGDALVEGPRDPKELLEIRGVRETQSTSSTEVQKVYREQGVSIHDKHIELIVRQMTRRVIDAGANDSDFLPGERVDQKVFADANKLLVEEGKRPPRVGWSSWASPRRRWPPTRGCRRPPSRRPPGCSPRRRSTPGPTPWSASRRTSSSASSSRPVPACTCTATSVCPIVPAIVALVFASMAGKEIQASGERIQGGGMVTAAKIVSWINIGFYVAAVIVDPAHSGSSWWAIAGAALDSARNN
jgi:hypothetical protein